MALIKLNSRAIPDATVISDDLADGAVTAAKIGSLPAGSVLQVVQSVTNTNYSTTGTTFSDTLLFASITPSSTSSKILVITNQNGFWATSTSTSMAAVVQLLRNGTDINSTRQQWSANTGQGALQGSMVYLDSPSSTSSVTYKTQARVEQSDTTIYFNWSGDGYSSITLMEIAG